ncbi:hypothetical protein [Amycolatopsis sp. NPDC059657]|uniref:hypothetical protein n=1 Tax=Amycolatopsis sp. NPDC059657 TaxID=3346899 RepID=UPI00366EE46E
MDELLDRIDALTDPKCGWCREALAADSASVDFCSQDHQQLWMAQRGDPLPEYSPTELFLIRVRRRYQAYAQIIMRVDVSVLQHAVEAASLAVLQFGQALRPPMSSRRQGSTPRFVILDELAQSQRDPEPDSRARRMQAALGARRNRNTGPAQKMRVPKRLDGKARR